MRSRRSGRKSVGVFIAKVREGSWRRGAWGLIALLSLVWFIVYRQNTALLPYYAVSDMDQLTTLDVLLIAGGKLPDHVTHPAAGMYLFLSWSQWFGRLVGLLHMQDYTAIYSWANPLLGIAELTEFLRAHLAFLAVGSALLLTGSLALVTRGGAFFLVFLFLCFAGSRSLAYHTILFRTDMFALFYAACSLFAALFAVETDRKPLSFALTVTSGIFAGLALSSKLQIVPTIAATPLLAMLMMHRNPQLSAGLNTSQRRNRRVATISISLYLALVAIALFVKLPTTFYHYRDAFSITPFCLAVGLSLAVPVALTERFKHQPDGPVYRFASFANLLGLGFVLSIPALALAFSNALTGGFYALAIAKIIFLGKFNTEIFVWPSLWTQFSYAPILLLSPTLMLCLLAFDQRRALNYAELALFGLIYLLFVISVLVFNRGINGQDIIYSEPLGLVLCGVLLHALWQRRILARIAAVGFSLLLAVNVAIQGHPSSRISAEIANYFEESRQLVTYFGRGSQGLFEGQLRRLFVRDDNGREIPARSRDAIFDEAADYRTIISQVGFSLPNQPLDWSRIGVVANGLAPYGQQRPAERFSNVAENLAGAISFIPRDTPPRRYADTLDKVLSFLGVFSGDRNAMLRLHPETIRTRRDLAVFVLVPSARKTELEGSENFDEIKVGEQSYAAVAIPAQATDTFMAKLAAFPDRIIVIRRKHS